MNNVHELFKENGPARQHFKGLAGGADWVDGVCDSIVNGTLYAAMSAISANKRVKFFTFYRIADDNWQVRFALDKQANVIEATKPTLYEAVCEALELTHRVPFTP